jgi:hypothetical protein
MCYSETQIPETSVPPGLKETEPGSLHNAIFHDVSNKEIFGFTSEYIDSKAIEDLKMSC